MGLNDHWTEVGSWYNGNWYGVDLYFDILLDKMHYFRYKYSNNTLYFKLLDEDMNVLSEQSSPYTIYFRNRAFMFGNAVDHNQAPNITVDLSETWFKDKDGNLISGWNK